MKLATAPRPPALFQPVRSSRDVSLATFAGVLLTTFALAAGAFLPRLSPRTPAGEAPRIEQAPGRQEPAFVAARRASAPAPRRAATIEPAGAPAPAPAPCEAPRG